jgi:peptidyl-tRNA hydrolase
MKDREWCDKSGVRPEDLEEVRAWQHEVFKTTGAEYDGRSIAVAITFRYGAQPPVEWQALTVAERAARVAGAFKDRDIIEIDADRRVMYLVIRTSLKMNAGKTAAAVGHAVQMLMTFVSEIIPTVPRTAEELLRIHETRAWLCEDAPSYAKIVLGATDEEFDYIQKENPGFLVIDRGFTMVEAGSPTCFGLYPMRKSEALGIVRTLKPLR